MLNFINNSYAYFAGGTVNTSQNVNYSNGGHQTFTVGADITLTLRMANYRKNWCC